MENRVLIVEHLATDTSASFTSAKRSEVLCSSWHDIFEQLKHDGALWLVANAYVEVNARIFQR